MCLVNVRGKVQCKKLRFHVHVDVILTEEIISQIRYQFEVHRGATNLYSIKYLLSDGRAQLKALKGTIERAK